MYYSLFDFQKRAVRELAKKLKRMQLEWHEDGTCSSISLVAPTGAGKTVICAALAEGLLFGNEFLNKDNNAVILWLSDGDSLNVQTLNRFVTSSDKFNEVSDSVKQDSNNTNCLKIIDNMFTRSSFSKFEPGTVYFLNRDKLRNNALLTTSYEGGRTFWDILAIAIEDPNINFYLFIDEAHRGFGSGGYKPISESDNQTIYSKIVDGQKNLNPPIPVVIGISATIERWDTAMNNRKYRDKKSAVQIDNNEVRTAGIIKDLIELRSSDVVSNIRYEDLISACHKLREFTEHWKSYYKKFGEKLVIPLMVIQLEDNISNEAIWDICLDIYDILPDLIDLKSSFAHVISTNIKSNEYINIPKVDADKVQELTHIRVLFAKEAISEGWDCPRAEVLYSRRRRYDTTYVTQMMGRMVRTPLGHRIKNDEFLNRVACYLPEYDAKTVEAVVHQWKTGKNVSKIVRGKEVTWYDLIKYKLVNLDKVLNNAKIVGYNMINDNELKGILSPVQYPLFVDVEDCDEKNNSSFVSEDISNSNKKNIVNALNTLFDSNIQIDGVDFEQITKKNNVISKNIKDDVPTMQSLFGDIESNYKVYKRVLKTKDNDKYIVKIDFNKIRNFFRSIPKTSVSDDKDIVSAFNNITACAVEKKVDNNFVILFSLINFLVTIKSPNSIESWENDDKIKEEFSRYVDAAIESNKESFLESERNIKERNVNIYFLDTYSHLQGLDKNQTAMDDVIIEKEEIPFENVRKSKSYCRNLYRFSKNLFNSDYINYYVEYLKSNKFYHDNKYGDIPYDDVMAIVRIAAVVNCKEVIDTLEMWVEKKIKYFINKYDKNRSLMTEEEKINWDIILGKYQKQITYKLEYPTGIFIQSYEIKNPKKAYHKHVICDGSGLAYFKLNTVEDNIVEYEIKQNFNVAWYRNPAHVSKNSLSILYKISENEYANFFPDFIFFERTNDGKITKSIVDPHGGWLADSLSKLRGYVDYIEKYPNEFARVLVVADIPKNHEYRALDLTDSKVRNAIKNFQGTMAYELFTGPLSTVYLTTEN